VEIKGRRATKLEVVVDLCATTRHSKLKGIVDHIYTTTRHRKLEVVVDLCTTTRHSKLAVVVDLHIYDDAPP